MIMLVVRGAKWWKTSPGRLSTGMLDRSQASLAICIGRVDKRLEKRNVATPADDFDVSLFDFAFTPRQGFLLYA